MKKKFSIVAGFLALYFVFVIALMPISFVLNFVDLPKNIELGQVSGSIWHSEISAVKTNELVINKVTSQLSVFSLLTLNPSIDLTFGDPLLNGPEGSVNISGLLGELNLSDLQLLIAANSITSQLDLPVPVQAHDFIDVKVEEFIAGTPVCSNLSGTIHWNKAAVTALDEKVKLGRLSAKLSCNKGNAVVIIEPKNDLGVTFTASVGKGYRLSGEGYLMPSAIMPKQFQELLPFLGNPDKKGRYRLRF
jgi:general secretion pathway protein N